MTLNCKPGDMALVYRRPVVEGRFDGEPLHVELLMTGRVVTIAKAATAPDTWIFEEPVSGVEWRSSIGFSGIVTCMGLPDAFLRPLPPLAEGEEDNNVAGLPAPRETTPA